MLKTGKDFLWIASGQIAGLLNNFLLLKLLTSSLSMAAYGYYALWMSILLVARQSIYDPLSIISAKETRTNFLGTEGLSSLQIVKHLTDKVAACLLLFCVIFVILEYVLFQGIPAGMYVLAGVIYLVSNGAQGIYLNIFNILRERKLAAAGIAADSFIKMLFVILALSVFESSLFVVICAAAVSSLVTFICVRHVSNRLYVPVEISRSDRLAVIKNLFILSLPFVAPTLLVALKGVGDKIFMTAFIGVEEFAAYNVLSQIGFIPMMLIIGVIQTYVSPNIYKITSSGTAAKKNTIIYLGKIIFISLSLSVVTILFSLFFSNSVVKLFVGVEYLNYSRYLPYFIAAGAFAGIAGVLNVALIGALEPKLVGLLMLFSILLGLITLAILILAFGFIGGIVGLVLANLILVLLYALALRMGAFKNSGVK